MPLLHSTLSCAISDFSPLSFIVTFTHSGHVFLPLPLPTFPSTLIFLHAVTQFSPSIRSKCPNHLNLPLLTTSVTLSIPNRPINSSLFILSDKVTPHILLTIILSVRSNLLLSYRIIATCKRVNQ